MECDYTQTALTNHTLMKFHINVVKVDRIYRQEIEKVDSADRQKEQEAESGKYCQILLPNVNAYTNMSGS